MYRTLKLALCLLLTGTSCAAATAAWNAARWQALFDNLPAPPQSLAQAGGLLTMVRPGPQFEGVPTPSGPVLRKSRADYHAAMDAMNAGATGASSTTDAMALAKRMQSAPRDQQIAMAMQYAAQMRSGAQAAASNREGTLAGMNVASYVQGQQMRIGGILRDARQAIAKLQAENDQRHDAVDALLRKAYLDCPRPPTCGDSTECSPNAACVAGVNARLPKLVAQHRQIAQADLANERAAYLHAYAALQPVATHLAGLLATAEQAGVQARYLQQGYTQFMNIAGTLQMLDARIVMRAGFWQGVQPKPVAPNYLAQVPAFYHFVSGRDELLSPPADLPKNW
jgi:hypothetical protein